MYILLVHVVSKTYKAAYSVNFLLYMKQDLQLPIPMCYYRNKGEGFTKLQRYTFWDTLPQE